MPSALKRHKDLNWYKKNVNLAEFILYISDLFLIDKKSTLSQPRFFIPLRDQEGNMLFKKNGHVEKQTILVLSISKIDGNYLYWDVTNGGFEKGQTKTIIDFVQDFVLSLNSFDYLAIVNVIEQYINSKRFISPEVSCFKLEPFKTPEEKILQIDKSNLTPYLDQTYLINRGFKETVINSPIFYPTIKNYKAANVIQQEINGTTQTKTIWNKYTAFLLINQTGLVGLNCKKQLNKDETFKKIEGNKSNSLYLSAVLENQTTFGQLVVTESAEDCMAHYQLHGQNQNKSIRYAATSGQVTTLQCDLLSQLYDKYNIEEFVLAMDNDTTGAFYNAKILSLLELSTLQNNGLNIDVQKSNKGSNFSIVIDKRLTKLDTNDILKTIDHFNPIDGKQIFQVKLIQQSTQITIINCDFFTTKTNWNLVFKIIHKLNYNDTDRIKTMASISSDFTQDIKTNTL